MIKLSFFNRRLEYDEDAGVCICHYRIKCWDTASKTVFFSRDVSGKAVKAPGDVQSIIRGKRLAESRCKYKAYKLARNYFADTVRRIKIARKEENSILAFYMTMGSYKNDEQFSIERAIDTYTLINWYDDYNY